MNPNIEKRLREMAKQEEEERVAYNRKHPLNRRAAWGVTVALLGGIGLSILLDELDIQGTNSGILVALFSSFAAYLPVARH